MVFTQPRGRAVVIGNTIFAEHQTIADLADGQCFEAVGIDFVQEFGGVFALNVDLAQRGHVADANGFACHLDLTIDRVTPAFFAGAYKPLRAQPVADLDKGCAILFGPTVAGGQAGRAEILAACPPGQCAKRDGSVGRAKDGGAGFGDGFARGFGKNCQPCDIRGLALIGRHAHRRIAFEQFDRAKALALALLDILDRHVVLQIDPGTALAFLDVPIGVGLDRFVVGHRQVQFGGCLAQIGESCGCLRLTLGQGSSQCQAAIGSPRDQHAGRNGTARNEGRDIVAPLGSPALVAGQMHIGVPAARDGERVQRDGLAVGQGDSLERLAPNGRNHARGTSMGDPRNIKRGGAVSWVDDGDDIHALGHQIGRRAPAIVIVGKDGDILARCHAPTIGIGAHGTGHHDAGAVVHAEGNRALGGTSGKDCASGIDAPQDLPGLAAAGGEVVGAAFECAICAVIISAVNRGPRHQPDIGVISQFRDSAGGPVGPGHAVQLEGFGVQATAGQEILIGQNDPRTRCCRHLCGGDAGWACADDQQIAMQKTLVIVIRVFLHREVAQTCGHPNGRFIKLFPKRFGPHEGLVIEPRSEPRGHQVVHCHQIVFQRAAMVLAGGGQPVEKLGNRRARVGFLMCAGAQLDERVGFFGPGGENPARAVVFERAAHQQLPICQERRGQRVTVVTAHALAVEGKRDFLVTVDQTAIQPVFLHHLLRPLARATSRAISTDVISWVSVSRVTTSHERSPCS